MVNKANNLKSKHLSEIYMHPKFILNKHKWMKEGKKEKNEGTFQAKVMMLLHWNNWGKKKGGDERGLDSANLTWDSLLC